MMTDEAENNNNQASNNWKNRDEHHNRLLDEFRKTTSWLDKELNSIHQDILDKMMNRIQKESEHVE